MPGDSILIYQNELLLKDGGMPQEYIAMYIEALKGMLESQKENSSMPFEESNYLIFATENLSNPVLTPLVKKLRENISEI